MAFAYHMTPKEEQEYIPVGNKVDTDIDNCLDNDQKAWINIVDQIVEIDNFTFVDVYKRIVSLKEYSTFLTTCICYAMQIRHKNRKALTLLLKMLKKDGFQIKINPFYGLKYSFAKTELINKIIASDSIDEYTEMFPAGSIERIIKDDNCDLFVRLTSDFDFDPNIEIKVKKDSPLYLVSNDTEFSLMEDLKVTLMQLMVFFGAVKCFKFALISGVFDEKNLSKFAIAGGNTEIIHCLEQKGVTYDNCFETSVKFHRYSISNWLLNNFKCEVVPTSSTLEYFNEKMFFFNLQNGFSTTEKQLNNAMISASMVDNIRISKLLHDTKGVSPDIRGKYNDSLLHISIQNEDLPLVKYLCETCHANIEQINNDGSTPLHIASSCGSIDIVKYLIEDRKVNKEAKNSIGWSPLHFAACNGNVEVIKYLVEQCDIPIDQKDRYGSLPLFYAISSNNLDSVKYFLDKRPNDINQKDKKGNTLLHLATQQNRFEIVKYLVEKGMSPYTTNDEGNDSMHMASAKGNIQIVKYLFEKCNISIDQTNKTGIDPLYFAALKGHVNVVDYLVNKCHASVTNKIINAACKDRWANKKNKTQIQTILSSQSKSSKRRVKVF